MSEPTLSLNYNDLASAHGEFMGWGRASSGWSADKAFRIDFDVKSGLRKFYFPKPPFDWTFLHPWSEAIPLKSGATYVWLPDDCAGIEGGVVVTTVPGGTGAAAGTVYPTIAVTTDTKIKALYAEAPQNSGRPLMAAIEVMKGVTQVAGQRQRLLIYPAGDTNYTLQFQYYVVPDAPTATNPFLYGGGEHSETILEAVLSVAEVRRDDLIGVHSKEFADRLAASMSMDRKKKAQQLGRNRDTSDSLGRRDWHSQTPRFTYNGTALN